MKKMLKIMAMLLVIATVVFAAGCASKETENKTTVANDTINQSTSTVEITPENTAENITPTEDKTVENVTDENATNYTEGQSEADLNTTDSNGNDSGDGTDVPTENNTSEENTT